MQKIKSIYEKLEGCTDELEQVELLAELSTEFLNSDIKRCAEVVDQLGTLAIKLGDPKALGYYYSGLGRIQYKHSKFPEAGIAFKIAIDYAIVAKVPMLEINCNHSLGMVYWKEGLFEESLEVSLKALKYFEDEKDPTGNAALCYNNVGNIYERLGEYDKAEEAYLQGMKILESIKEDRTLYNVMGNLGVIKLRKGQYEEAFQYLEPVYNGFKKLKHTTGEIVTLINLGQAFVGLKQYAKGMRYYLQALKMLKTTDAKFAEADVYRGLGKIYLGMEGYDEAMKHFEKSLEILKSIEYHSGVCEVYLEISELYLAMNNVEAALESINQGIVLATVRKLPVEIRKLEEAKNKLLGNQSQVA